MDLGLAGKVAIITGGSQGIGKATASAMVSEGALVVICARRLDILEAAAKDIEILTGGEILPVQADVSEPTQTKELVDKTINTYGRLDILVNNAGTRATSHFSDLNDEDWQNDLDLKLFPAIRLSRLAIPYMKQSGDGRIINVTNLGGRAPGPSSVPTSVSRAAGIALTKAMSKDYAADNILINTVCIGWIKSSQHERQWIAEKQLDEDLSKDDFYNKMATDIPIGRVGETDEAAAVITFLASAKASYITGVAINIDGGFSAII